MKPVFLKSTLAVLLLLFGFSVAQAQNWPQEEASVAPATVQTQVQAQVQARPDPLTPLEMTMLGGKFEQDSTETRLSRLEGQMGSSLPRDASLAYRLAQMQAMQQLLVPEEQQAEAIRMYNQAIDTEQAGHRDVAIQMYQRAIDLNPRLIQAYNNLGRLLLEAKEFNRAVALYEQGIALAPQESFLYRNLGVTLERMGKIQDALQVFKYYLGLQHQPDPAIESMVKNYELNRDVVGPVPDYTAVATRASDGRRLTWPRGLNPVPVYLRVSDPRQVPFISAVKDAMVDWEKASQGRLRFREVGSEREARIFITLQPGPIIHPFNSVAHATYDVSDDPAYTSDTLKVNVQVNTGEPGQEELPFEGRQEQVKRLALHELGHAIGIWGHSPNPDDIMYAQPIVSALSFRDINTVRRLYKLDLQPPATDNTPRQSFVGF